MDPKTILAELKEPDLPEAALPFWDEAMANYAGEKLAFLEPEAVKVSREWCGFPAEIEPVLARSAAGIRANPALKYLAWYYSWLLFDCTKTFTLKRPGLENSLGEDGSVFYLLIALGWVPRLRAYHRSLGVPEDITRETCQQVKCFCENYQRANNGKLGMFDQITWLKNYLQNHYFRLGRFEYWAMPFRPPHRKFRVFRNRVSGQVLALAEAGFCVNAQGYIEGQAGEAGVEQCWQTTLSIDLEAAGGYPITPRGKIMNKFTRLPSAEWKPALAPEMPVLIMHIPAGGGMALDKCGESMKRAATFFREYFPAEAPAAIITYSWMFSPLLEEILPPTSNLVQFLKELYLIPTESKGPESLWFVFLQKKFDLNTAPRETSLQRAILAYLEKGNTWRPGGMLMLVDDLPHFGSRYYRKNACA